MKKKGKKKKKGQCNLAFVFWAPLDQYIPTCDVTRNEDPSDVLRRGNLVDFGDSRIGITDLQWWRSKMEKKSAYKLERRPS